MKPFLLFFVLFVLYTACSDDGADSPIVTQPDGLLVRAGGRIQDAILQLTNGGTIRIEAGTYNENITLRSGIILMPSGTERPVINTISLSNYTIGGWGVSNILITGLHIKGGIEIGQIGSDFSMMSENIRIIGNLITDTGYLDGLHFGGITGVEIISNTIRGSIEEQGIDLVGVRDFNVAHNTVSHISNSKGMSIVAKGGSINGIIASNTIFYSAHAAIACGQSTHEMWVLPEAQPEKYEARYITVTGNTMYSNAKYAVLIMGARDCTVISNAIGASGYYADFLVAPSDDLHTPGWMSSNIVILQPGQAIGRIDIRTNTTVITLNGTNL